MSRVHDAAAFDHLADDGAADAVVIRGEPTDLLHVRHGEPLAIAGVIKRGTIVAGEMMTA